MTHEVSMTTIYLPSDEAVENRMGEETVLMNLGTGACFRLDAVGTRVWELLCIGATAEAICATLRAEYTDIGAGLEDDIRGFLAQLAERNLIAVE